MFSDGFFGSEGGGVYADGQCIGIYSGQAEDGEGGMRQLFIGLTNETVDRIKMALNDMD